MNRTANPCYRSSLDALYADVRRSAELERAIRAEIRAGGPMSFARFMELALYHDPLGYYRAKADATTRAGDFLTAPETHPLYGVLLARFAIAMAREMGEPAFTVVEQGAGTGALAESFVDHWRAECRDMPLRYVIVEPYGPARTRLHGRLGDRADVVAEIVQAAPFSGVYLSNELPDAYPVHRLRRVGGELAEIFVTLDGERLVETERPIETSELREWLQTVGIYLPEGGEIEANTAIAPWLTGISRAMTRGFVLTVDYGYAADESGRFPRGTLLAHYRHATNEDYLQRIGMQDLTAHVCWTALERFGERAGLRTVERTTQREFLTRWGWKEYGRRLLAQPGTPDEELDAVDRLGRAENGLGNLGVLLQAKGV